MYDIYIYIFFYVVYMVYIYIYVYTTYIHNAFLNWCFSVNLDQYTERTWIWSRMELVDAWNCFIHQLVMYPPAGHQT